MITKESIIDDLENNRLPLPTLPEVAIKVRETVDDENASIVDVAQIIETDAVLSARIIQVANSALYRGMSSADSVQNAAMRMGLNTVKNLTTSLVMKQLFQATHPVVDSYLRNAWKQSTDVAALSAMIAKHYTNLESDSALLAGLTHSIGLSPILVKVEGSPELLSDTGALERLLVDLYPAVGAEILKRWGFAEHMIRVPSEHLDINRQGNNGTADYTDIVQVALIQTSAGGSGPLSRVDEAQVSAFDRLDMRDSIEEINMSGGIDEMQELKEAIL
ncbi:MAG: HDOD domain-containing protein [Gammaproteobacteria bacterium]|nr:HDOD domain-containing protein [Gammaproteobacteria bacterium]